MEEDNVENEKRNAKIRELIKKAEELPLSMRMGVYEAL